jgi:hypothetical protein
LEKIIDSGESDNSIVSKNNSQTFSRNTISLGTDTIAGIKGYHYLLTDDSTLVVNGVEKTQLILQVVNKDGTPVSHIGYSVGDSLGFVQNKKYEDKLIITAINKNIITCFVNKTPSVYVEDLPADWTPEIEDLAIFCVAKPHIGTDELGPYATVFGYKNKVLNFAGFGAGYNNIVAGQYSAAFGRDHFVSYASFAAGRQNNIHGWYSLVGGRFNNVDAGQAAVFGEYNTVGGNDSIVGGK